MSTHPSADDRPQPGDIGLVQVKGRIGRLIWMGQVLNGDGFWNAEHAFVYVGGGQLVEAEPGGARLGYLGEYAGRSVTWLRCPVDRGPAVADAARSLIGRTYSWLDYFALAAHRLRIPVPGLRRYIADTGHLICSQLADQAAQAAGWHLFTDSRWPGYVTPAALCSLTQAGR